MCKGETTIRYRFLMTRNPTLEVSGGRKQGTNGRNMGR